MTSIPAAVNGKIVSALNPSINGSKDEAETDESSASSTVGGTSRNSGRAIVGDVNTQQISQIQLEDTQNRRTFVINHQGYKIRGSDSFGMTTNPDVRTQTVAHTDHMTEIPSRSQTGAWNITERKVSDLFSRTEDGGYQPSFSHESFWDRYFTLWDWKCNPDRSPSFLECSECMLSGNEYEQQILSMKLKRLIETICLHLVRMEQEDITEVYESDQEDVPYDIALSSEKSVGFAAKLRKRIETVTSARKIDNKTAEQGIENAFVESLDFVTTCDLVGILLGRSKVFVRRETYDQLEYMRMEKLKKAAMSIQSFFQRNSREGKYHAVYEALSQQKAHSAQKIQNRIRIVMARKKMKDRKSILIPACTKIQRVWKRYHVQVRTVQSATKIQSYWRGLLERRMLIESTTNVADIDAINVSTKDMSSHAVIHSQCEDGNQGTPNNADLVQSSVLDVDENIANKDDLVRLPVVLQVVEASPTESVPSNLQSFSSNATNANITTATSMTNGTMLVVDNVVLLNELYREIESENWAVVDILLEKYPTLIRVPDIKTGELALHKLVRHNGVPIELLQMVIGAFPKALQHKDNMGALPIHHAAAFDNVIELGLVYDAYSEGMNAIDKMGRLPIHVAAMYDASETVQYLLSKSSELALKPVCRHHGPNKSSGGLPLHVACANNASNDVIAALLAANSTTAKQTDENGDLPLHLLLRCGEDADPAVVRTLVTCFPGALIRADLSGNLPLLVAIQCQCTNAVIHTILTQNPDAARILDSNHQTPLVSALIKHADDRTILGLIHHAPELATAVDVRTGLLPIQFATEYEHSHFIVKYLLERDLPVDLTEKVQTKVLPHHFSWNHLVANTDDLYHPVVAEILKSCTQPQVLALAHAEGPDGRTALAAATVICRYELRVSLRLFGTLEVMTERPAYTNVENDTQIFYALRYEPAPQQEMDSTRPLSYSILHDRSNHNNNSNRMSLGGETDDYLEDYDDCSQVSNVSRSSIRSTVTSRSQQTIESKLRHIKEEKGVHVIVKLTSRSEIVEGELKTRKNFQLSRQYVPAILSVHHTVQHAAYYEAMAESGFCITMECADSTAENQMNALIRTTDRRILVKTLKRIGISLLHMHDHGLVHGDFGSHNIGLFGNRWKLLSIGGSVPIGERTNPRRGLYQPPESIQLVEEKRFLGSKQQRKIGSVKAYPSYDVWAFGALVYEIIMGVPLEMYSSRGHSPMNQSELARLGMWDENCLSVTVHTNKKYNNNKKNTHHPHHPMQYAANRNDPNPSDDDAEVVRDLLKQLLHHDPKMRPNSMRTVLGHRFFTSSGKSVGSSPISVLQTTTTSNSPSRNSTTQLRSATTTKRQPIPVVVQTKKSSTLSQTAPRRSSGRKKSTKYEDDNEDDDSSDDCSYGNHLHHPPHHKNGNGEQEPSSSSATVFRSPLRAREGVRKWRKQPSSSNHARKRPGTIVNNTRIQI